MQMKRTDDSRQGHHKGYLGRSGLRRLDSSINAIAGFARKVKRKRLPREPRRLPEYEPIAVREADSVLATLTVRFAEEA